ncbi:MAG: major facilitator superfamily domain-containing protein [Benjaminiella poitrasii]|nr:MAG: major facilitator superfamily domain-containing protein [Benjaminiella poitrasii]
MTDEYDYKQDPHNPMNWPKSKKLVILIIVSMNSFMGYFSSAVYMPATNDIRLYFNTNLTLINSTIALFLLMNAIAPLFWAPLSERIGRRWVYFVAMVLYTVCTIICGISTNLGLFFAFRLLQGIFACAGQAVGGGSVSDIFEPHERGKAMSIYILGTILGPAIAPMIGGYIDQYLGWRWIFYIKTIMGGVLTILNFLFLKETLYVPNAELTPTPSNFRERLQSLKFNPLGSLELLLQPEVAIISLPISVAFGWFYFLVTILPQTYSNIYQFSTGTIGLCYLAGGIGNTSGSIFAGAISDRLYARATAKNNGIAIKENRLQPIYIGIPFMLVGAVLYGWFLHIPVHFMGPLVCYTLVTFGTMYTITVANTYLVDSNHTKAASVVSVNNFTRNTCGMIFSLTSVQIRSSLGDGWAYTLMALMTLLFYVACVPIVQLFGQKWRERNQ